MFNFEDFAAKCLNEEPKKVLPEALPEVVPVSAEQVTKITSRTDMMEELTQKVNTHEEDIGKYFVMDTTKIPAQFIGYDPTSGRYAFQKDGNSRRSFLEQWACVPCLPPEKEEEPESIGNVLKEARTETSYFYNEYTGDGVKYLPSEAIPTDEGFKNSHKELTHDQYLQIQAMKQKYQESQKKAEPVIETEKGEEVPVVHEVPKQETSTQGMDLVLKLSNNIASLTDDADVLEMLNAMDNVPEEEDFRVKLPYLKLTKYGYEFNKDMHKTLDGYLVKYNMTRIKFPDGGKVATGTKVECGSCDGIHSFYGTNRHAMNCADCKYSQPGTHWDKARNPKSPGCGKRIQCFFYIPNLALIPLELSASFMSIQNVLSVVNLLRGEGRKYGLQPLRISFKVLAEHDNAVMELTPISLDPNQHMADVKEIFKILKTYKNNFVPGTPTLFKHQETPAIQQVADKAVNSAEMQKILNGEL